MRTPEDREYWHTKDVGYVTGLHAAAQWVAAFDQDLPKFDRETCQRLAAGLAAMTLSAVKRLGVNPDGTEARDWPPADARARGELAAKRRVGGTDA